MKKLKTIFLNVMTSGKTLDSRDEESMDTMVRYILLNSMIFLGCTLLVIFGFESLKSAAPLQAVFDFSMAGMTLLGFIILRTNAPFVISALLTVVPYMMLCAFLAFDGGVQGSGVLWAYSFPLLAVFLLGMKLGTLFSVLLLSGVSVVLFVPDLSLTPFPVSFAYRTVGVYILVLVCTMVYEQTKLTKERWVARLTRMLQIERDEMAAMKDNLKTGLFLMDREYCIQTQYSQALETVLAESDLSGKSFLDLLSNSLNEKEQETLKDYFKMVFERSFDAQMLEDINPLHEFEYVSISSAQEKTLCCAFVPIDREDGNVYILGTIEDRTREVELQQQLDIEEGKRQEQMRAMFEVIHVEPRVLHDFIVDTEYEFNRVNEQLKDNSSDSKLVVAEIYQSIHAIKSNALILGLESFSVELHKLEDELKALREKDELTFQDVLHITVELEKIMKIKDGFKNIIQKILSFNAQEGRLKEEQVLTQTLERLIAKTSGELGKQARLIIKKMDPQAIDVGPRRIIKEVLTQLVRNAMYHGLEQAEERVAAGKDAVGSIMLSIELHNDTIAIQLGDDGKGIDFEAILKKALEESLVPAETTLADRNTLLHLLFTSGFSTAESAGMHAGRGVGLDLIRDRVRECKGSIKIQSDEGRGTTFRILLPVEEASGARSA